VKALEKNKRKIGNTAEKIVTEILKKRGIEIIDANWRCHPHEIDIVGTDGKNIIFFEVKFRKRKDSFTYFPIITNKKQRSIQEAANKYMHEKGICLPFRFDVVYVWMDKNEYAYEIIEDAFAHRVL